VATYVRHITGFEVDDIFSFWLAISDIVGMKTPSVSPGMFPVMHTDSAQAERFSS